MTDLLSSKLYDNSKFYKAFEKDLRHAQFSVLIESPFITLKRMESLLPLLSQLSERHIRIVVNTRNPDEHELEYKLQALEAIQTLQEMGVKILYTVKHHRKLAIIDDEILWEGSLNILSQSDSCEIMRRIASQELVMQMMRYLRYTR